MFRPSHFFRKTFTLVLLSCGVNTPLHAAPGDVIVSFPINNITSDGRSADTPQGITYHAGVLYVVDFASDRIYRVYPDQVTDEDDNVLFNQGESDLNIPLTDHDDPPINSDGTPVGTCASATPAGQYCGGGGLTFAENFLWNASPITDHINKIDPVDGDNLETENVLASLTFPAPTDMAFDGTHFWIVDWQSNTINKVRPEDGVIVSTLPGPSSLPSFLSNPSVTNARPFGIAWDGEALWVSEQQEQMIYRMSPADGSILALFATPGTDPKGLTWDGEFLWHVDQDSGLLYKLESGVIPFGIAGCFLKNGVAIENSDVILSQNAITDQVGTTNASGCIVFPTFEPGVPVQLQMSETGVNQKPTLTLNDGDVTLVVGDTYVEPGFSAIDPEDGDITLNVVAVPDVINTPTLIDTSVTSPAQGYSITYNVIDSEGNAAYTQTRTVYVLEVDTTAPVITLIGDNPVNLEQGNLYFDEGATALDDRDGDLSSSIVPTGTVDIHTAGTYTISYDVADLTGNNATTVVRTVNVSDTTLPVITLDGANPLNLEQGDTYTDPGATASDNIDGDISGSIVVTGSVTTADSGTYVVSYDVSDSQGNNAVTATRTVVVSDTAAPTITLNGAATINHELNTAFSDPGANATDVPNIDLTSSIIVSGSVDPNTAGTYVLSYNVTDSDNNAAATVTRTVIVADTGAPSITMLGDNPLFHERGTSFTDPGATATDVIDGNLTSSVVTTGSVDANTTGSYTLTYDVSDSAGNAAPTQTRTVNVSDSTPPIITLLGNANINHELQTSYSDAGATASDNTGGDLTSSIVLSGSVNQNLTGIYTLTYNVTDSEGNAAAPVTRIVDVADRTAPTITLNGASTINHEVDTVFTDPGATASDIIDGDITTNIGVSGSVDASTVGSYTLNYNISDAAGNAATTVQRTVIVQDTGAPSITLLGDNPVLHELQTTFTDPGATASDAADGDLSASITVTGSVNENVAGTYTLNYNVSDSQGNAAATQTRTIIVADRTEPVITLSGSANVNHEQGTIYNDAGATASDVIDGNLSANITVTGSVNVNVRGTYTLRYNVSDSDGNAAQEVTRTVVVDDTTIPTITLISTNPFNHEVGTVFVDPGATATDNIDGNLTSSIGVSGTVDPSTVGTYTLSYNVSDSAGNAATTVVRTVNVADTGAPSITIVGDNPVLHEINTPYTDQGATAMDTVDGDLSGSITSSGSVNVNTAGSYSINYDVVDSGGNSAIQRTRTVIVGDYTAPTISLIGSASVNVELNTSYTDAGASASDAVDGDVSSSIVTTGSVDVFTAGTYTLFYDVSDSAGNAATQITRTVIVGDGSAPTITLIGASPLSHEQGTAYTDPGATASDVIDGDLTSSIVVSGFVNANAAGTYQLNYNVSDSSGNAATTVTRSVIVSDTTAPIITRTGNQAISHEINTTYSDQGATASDSVDGDLSANIVTGGSVDTSTLGTYQITYNVSDAAGNAATQVTRDVTVVDTAPPVITLNGASTINHEQGTAFTDPGATAIDVIDGNVTVTSSGTVDINTAGSYTLSYDAQDASGNAATTLTRNVIVADTIIPTISLVGAATIDHTSGSPFVDPGYSATDNIDGDITANVVVTYDTSATTYILSYNVSDAAGNAATTVQRTVNVVTPTTVSAEVETATIAGSHIVASTEAGFTGSGYVELKDDGYLELDITAYGVPYDLTIRYALDTADSPVEVLIDGISQGNLTLSATGSLGTWSNSATLTVIPGSGNSTLRIQPNFVGSGANIDSITLTPQ